MLREHIWRPEYVIHELITSEDSTVFRTAWLQNEGQVYIAEAFTAQLYCQYDVSAYWVALEKRMDALFAPNALARRHH